MEENENENKNFKLITLKWQEWSKKIKIKYLQNDYGSLIKYYVFF